MMQRKDFLTKLSIVAPALSDNDLLPVMTHYWFTGTELMAFNDQISISMPCKTDFEGAVPGKLLYELMKNSKAKNVDIEASKDVLNVKAASSRMKLAIMDTENFVFEMPKPGKKEPFLSINMDDFIEAVEICMRSVGMDTSVPDQLGVTLMPNGKKMDLYATNNDTLSHASISMKGKDVLKERVILSSHFCQQLLKIGKSYKGAKILISDDYSLLVTKEGVSLFGRLINSDRPIDFESILDDHYPKNMHSKLSAIPTKMKLIIERAMIISSYSVDDRATTVSVKDGKMKFVSKSDHGEISDSMQIDAKHPKASIRLDPKQLRLGYGNFDNILVTDNCAVMERDGNIFMIAAVSG